MKFNKIISIILLISIISADLSFSFTQNTFLAVPGNSEVSFIETDSRYSRNKVSQKDLAIARSCVWFYIRNGIYFEDGPDNVYQEIYTAFAEARREGAEFSKDELVKIAYGAASKLIYKDKKSKDLLKKYTAGDVKPIEGATFGERLKMRRLQKSMIQAELEKKIGVPFGIVSDWETGKYLPRPEPMPKLAEVLNATVSWLLAGMQEEELMRIRIHDEKSLEYRILLGFKIKVLQFKKGLEEKELNERMKVSGQSIGRWKRGNNLPRPPNMRKLAEVLDTTVSWLLAGMPEEELMRIYIEEEYDHESRILFGFKIKVLRYKQGLTASQLVEKLGISRQNLWLWETGKKKEPLKYRKLKNLALNLNTTPEQLYGIEAVCDNSPKPLRIMSDEEIMNEHVKDWENDIHRKIFGMKIKIFRKEERLTQEQLSNIIGKSKTWISNLENGKIKEPLKPQELISIVQAFNTTLRELLGITEDHSDEIILKSFLNVEAGPFLAAIIQPAGRELSHIHSKPAVIEKSEANPHSSL